MKNIRGSLRGKYYRNQMNDKWKIAAYVDSMSETIVFKIKSFAKKTWLSLL